MRIDSSGNVGIGTTSPDAKLEVTGGTNSDLFSLEGAGTSMKLVAESGNASSSNVMTYRIGMEYLGTYTNGFIDFYRGGGGTDGYLTFGTSGTEKMRIDGSGNVGIGGTPVNFTNYVNLDVKTNASGGGVIGFHDSGGTRVGCISHTESINTFAVEAFNSHPMTFLTNNAEAMRIDSSQRVGIGNTSPQSELNVKSDTNSLAQETLSLSPSTTNSSQGGLGVQSGGLISLIGNNRISMYTGGGVGDTEALRIDSSQDAHFDQDVIAFSTTPSDIRLKENFEKIENGLDIVSQLEGHTFNWKKGGDRLSAGFKAQEVEKILPHLVDEKKLPLKADDDKEYKILRYEEMIPYLVEAIKEQQQQIDELRKGNFVIETGDWNG